LRGDGFGVPGIRVDGNDVLACYAVTKKHMDDARAGLGPSMIEAYTYRMGAHTTSDDPSKYRDESVYEMWKLRDPITRFEKFLRKQGIGDDFFAEVEQAGDQLASELREATFALQEPSIESMFNHVYSEPHPLISEQLAWLKGYEASMGGHEGAPANDGDVSYGGAR